MIRFFGNSGNSKIWQFSFIRRGKEQKRENHCYQEINRVTRTHKLN